MARHIVLMILSIALLSGCASSTIKEQFGDLKCKFTPEKCEEEQQAKLDSAEKKLAQQEFDLVERAKQKAIRLPGVKFLNASHGQRFSYITFSVAEADSIGKLIGYLNDPAYQLAGNYKSSALVEITIFRNGPKDMTIRSESVNGGTLKYGIVVGQINDLPQGMQNVTMRVVRLPKRRD